MLFGYARVSTKEQDLKGQHDVLVQYGCDPDFIFSDVASGESKDNRLGLLECLARMNNGDVLVATHVDRLSRSVHDIVWILDKVEQKKGHICIVHDNLETKTENGRFVFQFMGIFASMELKLRESRAKVGIE